MNNTNMKYVVWNIFLFFGNVLICRLVECIFFGSATTHAMPPEFGRKWGTECLSLGTLLCAGYSVKLIWFDSNVFFLVSRCTNQTSQSRSWSKGSLVIKHCFTIKKLPFPPNSGGIARWVADPYQSEGLTILSISFPQLGIKLITCGVYCHTLVTSHAYALPGRLPWGNLVITYFVPYFPPNFRIFVLSGGTRRRA